MKPNFALDLSHDGIALMHRGAAGWTLVGEVALDDPALSDQLAMLRKTAADLDKGGLSAKLIIPNSQILYTSVEAPGPDDIAREVQIREALEGMTPYEVGELVFDWRAKGKMARVAVVARETLDEAEAFAAEHRFNPVAFVARPEGPGFSGEAFFGRAKGAGAILGASEQIERDDRPVPTRAKLANREAHEEVAEEVPEEVAEETTAAPAPPEPAPLPEEAVAAAPAAPEPPAPVLDDAEEDARIAALLADVPEPDLTAEAEPALQDATPPETAEAAPEEDRSETVRETPRDEAGTGEVELPTLAPFPLTLDDDDLPAQFVPAKPAKPARKPAKPAKAKAKARKPAAAKPPKKAPPKPEPAPQPAVAPETAQPAPDTSAETPADIAPASLPTAKITPLPQKDDGPTPGTVTTMASAALPSEDEDLPAFSSRRISPPEASAVKAEAPPADAETETPTDTTPKARPRIAAPPPPPRRNVAPLKPVRDASENKARTPTVKAEPPAFGKPDLAGKPLAPAPKAAPETKETGTAARSSGLLGRFMGRHKTDEAPASPPAPPAEAPVPPGRRFGLGRGSAETEGAPQVPVAPDIVQGNATDLPAPETAAAQEEAPRGFRFGRKPASPAAETEAPAPAFATASADATDPEERARREADAMTLFGARRRENEAGRGGMKLGLILTLILLLVMAAVALWSVFFLSDRSNALLSSPDDNQFAAASVPEALDTAPLQPVDIPGSPGNSDLSTALPGPDAGTGSGEANAPNDGLAATPGPEQPLAPDAGTAPAPPVLPETALQPEVLSDEAAQARYAATGIWQKAPAPPAEGLADKIDDIYIASIDPRVPSHDADALPPLPASDAHPPAPAPPPPPGTSFALDGNGLVTPSPEGTLSPDGILIFSGPPQVLPKPRPEIAAPAAPDIPRIRPKPRPTSLVEDTQRGAFGGLTLAELSAKRPRARPEALETAAGAALAAAEARAAEETAQAVADAVTVASAVSEALVADATAEAVAASPAPGHRPNNFARIVAAARSNQSASDGSSVQTASAAATVVPSIPSSANVARAATARNSINLNRINLIGIYGSASSRRALVRLKSGRYVKVSVGDRLDGGKVVAITEGKLVYQKGGRNHTLEVRPLG